MASQIETLRTLIAAKQAEMDQLKAGLTEAEEAHRRKASALAKEVERMLSGNRHYWEARDPQRVLSRLAAFVDSGLVQV